jgi:hypothetical protein
MIDRRTFIQGAALLATAPAITARLPLWSVARASLTTEDEKDGGSVKFKIYGWDHCDAEVSIGNEVLIRVDRSWHAAWR